MSSSPNIVKESKEAVEIVCYIVSFDVFREVNELVEDISGQVLARSIRP